MEIVGAAFFKKRFPNLPTGPAWVFGCHNLRSTLRSGTISVSPIFSALS
jgi:hypothetical protein